MTDKSPKTVLFQPINAAGHTNSSLAIADRLKRDYGYRCVFLMVGPPHTGNIERHGHELIVLDELEPYEDFEIEEGEDPSELDEERKLREGKTKRKFDGASRWPQLLARNQRDFMGPMTDSNRNIIRLVVGSLAKTNIQNSPRIELTIEQVNPDLIVTDCLIPAPGIVLNEHQRPWVRLQTPNPLILTQPREGVVRPPANYGFSLYTRQERERMRREEPQKWAAIEREWEFCNKESAEIWAESYGELGQLYRSRGCMRFEGKLMVNSPYLNVYLYPEALDYDQERDLLEYPARLMRCDSLIYQPIGQTETSELKWWNEQLRARAEGKQVVFFGLGSIASGNIKLMQRYMDMLAADTSESRLYVVSKGVNGDKLTMNERNMIGDNYVPQPFLLQRADLAIIHGGNNSVTECLHYGLPMIVLPNFFDQFDNAQRVEDLRFGRRLDIHKCTREQLLGAVDELLADGELRQKMRTIGLQMQARDECGKLARVLSGLVERKSLDEELARKFSIKLGAKASHKTILFLPLNAAGHTNSSLAIADKLSQDHGFRCVFLVVGPPHMGEGIRSHGHELIEVEDAVPFVDYELEPGEDPLIPVDEELKRAQGKLKRSFVGAEKWPQMIARNQQLLYATPVEAYKKLAKLFTQNLVPSCIESNPGVERAIEQIDPDLIVSDMYQPPPSVLLNEAERPWVRLQTGNPIVQTRAKSGSNFVRPSSHGGFKLYTKEERERIRREEPLKWQSMMDEWARASGEIADACTRSFEKMREFYKSHGCDRLEVGQPAVNSPYLNVYMFPEAVDYDQDDDLFEYPARWLRCDSLMRNTLGDAEMSQIEYWSEQLAHRNPDGAKPVIFFSLGSIASGNLKLMQRYIDILAQDPHERLYVISKGVYGDKLRLNEHNMIGGNYVPQPFLLQRSKVAIIHGGNNSLTECLYYGVPMIVLPNFSDQYDNAQRVEDLALGKRLNLVTCSGDELLGAVDELLNDVELNERIGQIGEKMRSRDELGKLSLILADLVQKKRLDEELAAKYNIKLE